MLHSHLKLRTPLAAALALALVSGGALAAAQNDTMSPPSSSSQSPSNQPSNNQQSSDQQSNDLQSNNAQSSDTFREGQLWATYVINPALQSYRIDADVQGSDVTLTGTVDNKPEKLLAGAIAQQVKGVTTVKNNIKIDPSVIVVTTFVPANAFAQHVRNATTSAAVDARLLWNQYTDGLDIKVKTNDGKVTLSGTADNAKAKQRAGEIASNTRGVNSVDNQLTVGGKAVADSSSMSPMIDDNWIKDKVRTSYMFTAGMDTADVDVGVANGTVTLNGTVDSSVERQRAINIAQNVLGVKGVKADGLRVAPDNVASN